MLSEPLSHPHGLSSHQELSSKFTGSNTSEFLSAAQSLLSHSDRYFAVALIAGELVTHWYCREHVGAADDQEVSTAHASALLPTLNLLTQTMPRSHESDVGIGTRVSYTYTHQGKAQALHALTYEGGATVLIASAQSSSERAHFWLSSHHEELKRHAQISNLSGQLDHAELATIASQR